MNTTHNATALGQAAASKRFSNVFKRYWDPLQARRKRHTLRANLSSLSDVQLMDIGITRGEVDYVVLNLSIDPRGVRSTPPMRDQRPNGR
jgi:uncharacterized protein YjiS (DUF1127 family)